MTTHFNPPTKTCCDCKEELPLKAFKKHGNMRNNYMKRCIECEKKRVKMKEGSPEYKKHFFVHDNFYL